MITTRKRCKIKIIKEPCGVFPQYQPKLGRTYFAEYIASATKDRIYTPICVVNVNGKRIILRRNEFEILG